MLKRTLNKFKLVGSSDAVNAAERCFGKDMVIKKEISSKKSTIQVFAESMCSESLIPDFAEQIEKAVEAALKEDPELHYGVMAKRGN